MNLTEALTITGLGISVVFSGLILTSLLISSFSFFPRLFARRGKPSSPAAVSSESQATAISPPPDPEVVAVITTVLEVEFRLRMPLLEGRFTFHS